MRGDSVDRAIQHYYDTLHSDDAESVQPIKPDRFMEQLVRGTAAGVAEIDKKITAKSEHWRVERDRRQPWCVGRQCRAKDANAERTERDADGGAT